MTLTIYQLSLVILVPKYSCSPFHLINPIDWNLLQLLLLYESSHFKCFLITLLLNKKSLFKNISIILFSKIFQLFYFENPFFISNLIVNWVNSFHILYKITKSNVIIMFYFILFYLKHN